MGICGIWRCERENMFVNCGKTICGDPPHCCFDPFDNSDEAMERRKRWMEDNE
jgi:hypothetical protein